MRLEYIPVFTEVLATNVRTSPLLLGRIRVSVTDGFVFPEILVPEAMLIQLTTTMTSTSPVGIGSAPGGTFGFTTRFRQQGFLRMDIGYRSYATLPALPHPTGLGYGVTYDPFTLTGDIPFRDGEVGVLAQVGLVPEPSSTALSIAGLAGIASILRIRRRSPGTPVH
jgi:hypothetical protein